MALPEVSQAASVVVTAGNVAWFGTVAPDVVLPSQSKPKHFFESMPEHGLLWAVLNDAVACALLMIGSIGSSEQIRVGSPAVRRAQQLDALAWIESDERDWPFSFLSICTSLGISPEYVRENVVRQAREMIAQGLSQHPSGKSFGRTKSTGGGARHSVTAKRTNRKRTKEQREAYRQQQEEKKAKRRANLKWE